MFGVILSVNSQQFSSLIRLQFLQSQITCVDTFVTDLWFILLHLWSYFSSNIRQKTKICLARECGFEVRLTMALGSTGSKPVEDWTFSGFFVQFLQSWLSCADQFIISYQLQEKILEIFISFIWECRQSNSKYVVGTKENVVANSFCCF